MLLLALCSGAAAFAAGPGLWLLGPSGTVGPDGFEVALRRVDAAGRSQPLGAAALTAEGGQIEELAPTAALRRYRVVAKAGARQVRLRARAGALTTEATFPVGPPSTRLTLSLDPPAPVKGRELEATLTVRVLRPDGAPDLDSATPVLKANVGTIEGLHLSAPGQYTASYRLPATRYPEVAVVVALCAWPYPDSVYGAVGGLRVPLSTAIELPGQTEPEAQMSISLAGTSFGPVRAGADGRFKLPVVVPPGFGRASGVAVDKLGNRRTLPIDLRLPPTDQLACVVNPSRLPNDGSGKARVLCATSDPFGKVLASSKVRLVAQRGTLSPGRAIDEGLMEWTYWAPPPSEATADVLRAEWFSGKTVSREELSIELQQGPAARAQLLLRSKVAHRGARIPLGLQVADAFGRPRAGATLVASASTGALVPLGEGDAGVLAVDYRPPLDGGPDEAQLSLSAYGPLGERPARLWAWAEGDGLFGAVVDLEDRPVPRQKLLLDGSKVVTGDDGTARLRDLSDGRFELGHAAWPGLRATLFIFDEKAQLFPLGHRPSTPPVSASMRLAPAVPVNVRLEVSGRKVRYWVESPEGEVLEHRELKVALSSGTLGAAQVTHGIWSAAVNLERPGTLSVADVVTGVTALAEVRP